MAKTELVPIMNLRMGSAVGSPNKILFILLKDPEPDPAGLGIWLTVAKWPKGAAKGEKRDDFSVERLHYLNPTAYISLRHRDPEEQAEAAAQLRALEEAARQEVVLEGGEAVLKGVVS